MFKISCTTVLLVLLISLLRFTDGSTYQRTTRYHDDVVATCNNKNDNRVKLMMAHEGIDVWKIYPSGIVDMRMNKYLYSDIQGYLRDVCYVSIQNVEAHVEAAEVLMLSDRQKYMMATTQEIDSSPEEWFKEYHDFPTITKWYKKLSQDHSGLVKVQDSIGVTEEGRHLSAVHITADAQDMATNKPKFYMQCLIHAREWISGSACMYLANKLVTGYQEKDARITSLMNSMEFVIVPVVNPDGYVYSWLTDRMWRKNRVKLTEQCTGVDLNRNFPTGWKPVERECLETYPGVKIASEKETAAIMNHYKKHAPFVGAIDFHSYGQLVLRPNGYTGNTGPDEAFMDEIGEQLVKRMKEVEGKTYVSQKSHDLYEAHGIASDWFYTGGRRGDVTVMSYTIELRDKGNKGFILPRSEIQATCEEVTEGFLYLAEKSISRYRSILLYK